MFDVKKEPDEVPLEKIEGSRLQILSDNIPGGMFSCLYDEALTLQEMNHGFLSMLGYTRREIAETFQDSFWEMIDVRDREATRAEVAEQLKAGNDKELEYRMKRKDGSTIWVLDKGHLIRDEKGTDYFCCVLVDITRSKELESELRLSLERHQIIMDQSTDILFDWDIERDTILFSRNWNKKFGCDPVTEHVSCLLMKAPQVYEEDHALFYELFQSVRNGNLYGEREIRFIDNDKHIIWCRVRISGQKDESGHVVRAVGVIIDITLEKQKADMLMERAQRDDLTRLFNKGTVQECIEGVISHAAAGMMSALLIIDLDNFKHINDSMGHLFGDALLAEVAHILQKQFSGQDIVGRVGGDEFVVFIKEIPYISMAERKAAGIMEALKRMIVQEISNSDFACSIGIAVYPNDGKTYHELFHNADKALYRAKKLGKDRYCLFTPGLVQDGFLDTDHSAANARIDSDEDPGNVELRLVEFIFRILYKASDLDTAVNAILEVVGHHLDVSRVYIFEDDEDDRYCSNTFEWCNEGIEPEKENLQHIRYAEDLPGGYRSNFDENGVFYCRDVSALSPQAKEVLESQGIKSVLQCAIYGEGKYKGFIGFDECRVNRFWTQEQVNMIVFISEILSTFLLKMRTQKKAVQNAVSLETILDNQSSWVYVIDQHTFEMKYINRRTYELVPGAKKGKTCHSAFYYRDTPCEGCPVSIGRFLRASTVSFNTFASVVDW